VNQASTASDLVQIALTVLQPGAAPADPRMTGSFPHWAFAEFGAFLCAAAAMGCGLGALWIYASPALGAVGALLVVSAILCAAAFAAVVFEKPIRDLRAPSPVRGPDPGAANDALLAEGSRFFRQHPVLTLAAAVLAGALMGGEN
jgi:hypothetical protein